MTLVLLKYRVALQFSESPSVGAKLIARITETSVRFSMFNRRGLSVKYELCNPTVIYTYLILTL